MKSISKSTNLSPISTRSPALTWVVKPSPFRLTVSNPMWIKISTPSFDSRPIACFVSKTITTLPLIGETTSPTAGSIATPLPNASLAKAASSTCDKGIAVPAIGERKVVATVAFSSTAGAAVVSTTFSSVFSTAFRP
jgi:hypothetical protein